MRSRRHTEEIKVRLTEHQRKMLEGMAGICDVPVAVMARTLLLDRLARERVEKRETVALVSGNELVRDKPETRDLIADWLCAHEPDHRALGWL